MTGMQGAIMDSDNVLRLRAWLPLSEVNPSMDVIGKKWVSLAWQYNGAHFQKTPTWTSHVKPTAISYKLWHVAILKQKWLWV